MGRKGKERKGAVFLFSVRPSTGSLGGVVTGELLAVTEIAWYHDYERVS